MAHVMVEEGLYDARFVAEQTDLPLLVRSDTRRFLRGSDLGGRRRRGALLRLRPHAASASPRRRRTTLALGALDPALEGEYRVATRDGEVTVTPVFALLREQLADYTPEAAAKITGTSSRADPPPRPRDREAKAAAAITQTNFSKFYHGLEMERAQILVFTLAGQIGKKGAGIAAFPFLSIAGPDALAVATGKLPPKLGARGCSALQGGAGDAAHEVGGLPTR